MLPLDQMAAAVFTGNLFIFDVLVSVVVSLMGLVIALILQRYSYATIRRWLGLASSGNPAATAA